MKLRVNDSALLRTSVLAHHVSFNIQLGKIKICRRVVEASFLLNLSAHHDGNGNCCGAPCPACIGVLQSLLGVADAIRPFKYQSLPRTGWNCEQRIHFASAEGRKREVTLGVEIRVRQPFAQATDGWALAFLEDIDAALIELGCRSKEGVGVVESYPHLQSVEVGPTESEEARTSADTMDTKSLLTA
jgi:hypothetical protein